MAKLLPDKTPGRNIRNLEREAEKERIIEEVYNLLPKTGFFHTSQILPHLLEHSLLLARKNYASPSVAVSRILGILQSRGKIYPMGRVLTWFYRTLDPDFAYRGDLLPKHLNVKIGVKKTHEGDNGAVGSYIPAGYKIFMEHYGGGKLLKKSPWQQKYPI
jgi:hypothetical protein